MKKKIQYHKRLNVKLIIAIFLLLVFFILLLLQKNTASPKGEKLITSNAQSSTNDFFTKITPTIISVNDKKSRFVHPNNDFSFEYPSNWQLTIEKHNYSEDWYEVLLSNYDPETSDYDSTKFRIHFSVNGRDYPNYREEIVYKTLGQRNIKWITLFDEDKAVEAFTQFPNNDFGDKLIGLYIYLPEQNQEQFIKQVEEIIASLE